MLIFIAVLLYIFGLSHAFGAYRPADSPRWVKVTNLVFAILAVGSGVYLLTL